MTVVEVPQDLNATVDVATDQAMEIVTEVNDIQPNGILPAQQQVQATIQQVPSLFDMDLERMHSELFRGRYLTPQDFMDDISKILHNADVRSHEDLDRLYRAQAMFTAAQVSIQEFDPQFRLECERTAVRERQRREERKKEREKEKEKEQPQQPMPIRRSARANGLQPEHSITDPVKLERRLKRQRGEVDGSGGDSLNTSEGEGQVTVSTSHDGGRDAKRTRIIVEEGEDDRDPLDTLGQTPGSEVRSHVVRFTKGPFESPLVVEPQHQIQVHGSPFPHSNHPPPLFPNHPPTSFVTSDGELSFPSRSSGFNPALLNPMQPSEQPFLMPTPYSPQLPEGPFLSVDPLDPFVSQPHPQHPYLPASRSSQFLLAQNVARDETPPIAASLFPLPPPSPVPRHPSGRQATPMPTVTVSSEQQPMSISNQPQPEPTPMEVEVERTPTPLPDFHVSPTLVDKLSRLLRDQTTSLTIEQLEQLRATCLGAVWRYRKEWDRDNLIMELMSCVKEFVCDIEEFALDDVDEH